MAGNPGLPSGQPHREILSCPQAGRIREKGKSSLAPAHPAPRKRNYVASWPPAAPRSRRYIRGTMCHIIFAIAFPKSVPRCEQPSSPPDAPWPNKGGGGWAAQEDTKGLGLSPSPP